MELIPLGFSESIQSSYYEQQIGLPMYVTPDSSYTSPPPEPPNSSPPAVETQNSLNTDDKKTKRKRVKVDWPKHKDELKKLFVIENRPLSEVKRWMESTHSFPKMQDRAYEKAFQRLLITKNVPSHVMRLIVQEVKKRKERGKDTIVRWHGAEVDRKKIERAIQDTKRRPATLINSTPQDNKTRKVGRYLRYSTPATSRESSPELNRQNADKSDGEEDVDESVFPWDLLRRLVQEFELTEFVRTYDESILEGFEYGKSEREHMRLIKEHLIILSDPKFRWPARGQFSALDMQRDAIDKCSALKPPQDFNVFTLLGICKILCLGRNTDYNRGETWNIVKSLLRCFQARFGDERVFSPLKIIALCEAVDHRWPNMKTRTSCLVRGAIESLKALYTASKHGLLNEYLGEFWKFTEGLVTMKDSRRRSSLILWYEKNIPVLSYACTVNSIFAWIKVLVYVAVYQFSQAAGEPLPSHLFKRVSILLVQASCDDRGKQLFGYRNVLLFLVSQGYSQRVTWSSDSYAVFLAYFGERYQYAFGTSLDLRSFRAWVQVLTLCCIFEPERAAGMMRNTTLDASPTPCVDAVKNFSARTEMARIRQLGADIRADDWLLNNSLNELSSCAEYIALVQ